MESVGETVAPIPPSQPLASAPLPSQFPETPQSNNRFIIILSIIIVILLGITGFFAYQYFVNQKQETLQETTLPLLPTPVSLPTETGENVVTANWKVFSDEKQGITYKYPNNWYAESYSPNMFSVFLDVKPVIIPEASSFLTPIHIGYNEELNSSNVKSYPEKTLAEGVVKYKAMLVPDSIKMRENLTVGGKEAVQLTGVLAPGMLEGEFAEYTLIQMDGKLLVITLLINKEYQTIYDQIISTFTFE